MGEGAKSFVLSFPQSSPNSVLIKGEDGDSSQMGVYYDVRLQVGDSSDKFNLLNFGLIKNSVRMSIRKVTKGSGWLAHYLFTIMNTQKKGNFQFCFPGLLGIHRNPN